LPGVLTVPPLAGVFAPLVLPFVAIRINRFENDLQMTIEKRFTLTTLNSF